MSLSPETMMDLMAYADGELDEGARARVEELLRTSEEARRVVAAMGTLGEVVRDGAAERAPESARVADGIVDGVMAALAADTSKGGKVTSIAAARGARGRYVAGAVAIVALAAGFALYLRASSGPAVVVDDHGFAGAKPSAVPAPAQATAPPAAVAEGDQGVDLEEAESAQGKVDVFFTPSPASAGAVASVVVWIDDRHGGH